MIYNTMDEAKREPPTPVAIYEVTFDAHPTVFATSLEGAMEYADSVRFPGEWVKITQHRNG